MASVRRVLERKRRLTGHAAKSKVMAGLENGQGRPRDIYRLLAKRFPSLTKQDLEERLESSTSKWTNRVQWVRQALLTKGDLASPERGSWAIIEKGRARLAVAGKSVETGHIPPTNLMALHEEYVAQFKANLLERLLDLSPVQFEHFAKKLLIAYGFISMEVTSVSHDGGIDGYGRLKVGVTTINVAFQCKRWQKSVQRPEVDKFRGAIQGEFEQGIFFTTSDFTDGAKAVPLKKGAVPIIVLDGEFIRHYQALKCRISPNEKLHFGGAYAQLRGCDHTCRVPPQ